MNIGVHRFFWIGVSGFLGYNPSSGIAGSKGSSIFSFLKPKCPSANEWIKELWYIYTMEFYSAERKKELIPFATAWMELESIMLSEISQTVRDKCHMISPLTGT